MVVRIERNTKQMIDILIMAMLFCAFMAGFWTGERLQYKKDKEYYENLYSRPSKPINPEQTLDINWSQVLDSDNPSDSR